MPIRSVVLGLALTGTVLGANPQSIRIAHPQLGVIISDKDGETVGQVADILRAAAAREQLQIVFVPMAESVSSTLKSGAAEAIAPFLVTAEASQDYDFSTTLMTTGGGLFVRATATAPDNLQVLANKTIVTPGFGPFVRYIGEHFPAVHVVTCASYADCLDRVLAGHADAAALNVQEGASIVSATYRGKIAVPLVPFMQESLALAVLKGTQAELLSRIDAGLNAIRIDGTLDRIAAKWNPHK